MKKITKILPISDIHLETHGHLLNITKENVDIVLLAGDIGNKHGALKFIEGILDKGIIVIYVLGNHEFYNINTKVKTLYEIKDGWKDREAKYDNFYVLDNESLIINNIKIIGSIFWTKLTPEKFPETDVKYIAEHQSDLKYIVKEKTLNSGYRIKSFKTLSIDDYNDLHNECLEYVKDEINKDFDGVKILLTHYPILKESQSKLFNHDKFESQFYTNDYEDLVISSNLDYIIHGHIHESFNYRKKKTQNICNPLGYKKYDEENKDFNESLILKIETE